MIFFKKADEKKSLYAYFATDCMPYPYRMRLFSKDMSNHLKGAFCDWCTSSSIQQLFLMSFAFMGSGL